MPAPVPTWATVTPGQYDTAALFNAVSAGGGFLTAPPVFQAYQGSAQSIANNSVVALGLDTTVVDTYGGHSNVTNNTRYTCQTGAAGWYLILGYFGLAANATGVRLCRINKNGATLPLSQSDLPTPGTALNLTSFAAALVQLAVGDYVEVCGFQTSGGALNTATTDSGMVALWVHS